VFTVAPGDRQGRGLDRLAYNGLIKGQWVVTGVCRRRWEKWLWQQDRG
jgi:hypothetical protein